MKVAIFDVGNSHHTYLYSQYKIFENDEIDFYVSSKLKNSLEKSVIKMKKSKYFFIKDNDQSILNYFNKSIKKINQSKYDYIFINTLQNDWLCYAYFFNKIKNKEKIILSIHNINGFISNKIELNPKKMIVQFIKKYALKKSGIINVYGENMKKYLFENSNKKKITTLPFSIFEPLEKKSNLNKLKIVIPGSFNIKRRDYETLYKAIEKLNEISKNKMELVLLGKPMGEKPFELFYKFKKLKNVKSYEKFVSEEIFEKEMLSADIILGPTNLEIYYGNKKEIYGITKESGVTFAMIRYALPGIIPSNIEKLPELKEITLDYSNSDELSNKIEYLINDKDYLNKLKEKANIVAEKYNSKNVKLKFEKEVREELC